MRDGVALMADVHRPQEPGQYSVLIAASPHPRQIQNLGALAGFIEAGASDFFVPRGYVHVIANCRGMGGSGGTIWLPYFHAEPSNRCRLGKRSAIGSRWFLMFAASGLVISFASTLLRMTKIQTDQHSLHSGTPAWVPIPSTPFFLIAAVSACTAMRV
jgi:hypothetical protein